MGVVLNEDRSAAEIDSDESRMPVLLLRPSRGWAPLRLREVWDSRELLYLLAWRDVAVRYKQTVLGIAWVVIQPLLTTLIFTVIFGNLAGIRSGNTPYALFALAGLVPWNFFSSGVTRASSSLLNNAGVIGKVYFPRLLLPLANTLAGLVDVAVVLVLLLALTGVTGYGLALSILTLPLFLLLALGAALGVGLWLSALVVQYRDVNYLLPFFIQFWLFATPVVYPASLVPAGWRWLYALNPMAGVVEGFRWALFGGEFPAVLIGAGSLVGLLVLVSGAYFFRRMERRFADVV